MGTRIRFPRMVPTTDWAPPFFPASHFHEGNVIGHAKGPGPASLNSGYGSTHRSIKSGAPFGRARGCFGGPVGVPHGREPRGGVAVTGVMPEIYSPVAKSLITPRMQDGVRGASSR